MRLPAGARAPSVRRRLTIVFALLIGLIAVIGAAGVVDTVYERSAVDELSSRVLPTRAENLRLHIELSDASRQMREYLLTGDPAKLAAFRQSRNAYRTALSGARAHAAPDAQRYLATQEQEIGAYLRIAHQQESAAPLSPAAARLTAASDLPYSRFVQSNAALDTMLNNQAEKLRRHDAAVSAIAAVATGLLLLLAVALALFAALRTTRAITRPLADAVAVLGRLARGDYRARARESGPAEIQAVARSVNALADENERLREDEQERNRLAAEARGAGIAIRDATDVNGVLDAAVTRIGSALRADWVLLLLTEQTEEERAGESEVTGHQEAGTVPVVRAWNVERGLLPEAEVRQVAPPAPLPPILAHVALGTSFGINDIGDHLSGEKPLEGAPGGFGVRGLPPEMCASLSGMGAKSLLATPFSAGKEAVGVLVLIRSREGDPWLPREVEAAEPIVGGLGRALQQSRAYRQETQLVEKLRALDKAKNDFLSTVSHELRTPLTSIIGYLELLEDEEDFTAEQRHMLDVVGRNAVRLRSLIEDLLTLSRIEAGRLTSHKLPIDLNSLVASALEAIKPAARDRGIVLEKHTPDAELGILGDADQLDRVLMNLLSNAVKFTPRGGRIEVGAVRADGQAVLSVRDTGIGIPQREQRELFNRFFRASNATELAIPGTGLGLAIVRSIVANHDGEIEVESEENHGTTITARLPLREEGGGGEG